MVLLTIIHSYPFLIPSVYPEITADTKVEKPDVFAEKQVMRKHIRNLLCTLAPREEKIIKLRYGIGCSSEKRNSLSEIGAMFGLSKERVRQIESEALHKLKESLNSHGVVVENLLIMLPLFGKGCTVY
ncbi:RNA polymerase sigma factor sigF chloroplastic [Bienertia sinuspersici]